MIKLSILIATIKERQELFDSLNRKLNLQLINIPNFIEGGLVTLDQWVNTKPVEILFESDNKELPIGTKRQKLLERAQGEWIVFLDDDDDPSNKYVDLILDGMSDDVDCMGIRGKMTTNGSNPQTWCHRLGREWCENSEGFDYIRPIIHFNPVRRKKALEAGFRDLRFGEDKDYADRLNLLLTKEYYIDEELFHYRYSNKINHNVKYGIK